MMKKSLYLAILVIGALLLFFFNRRQIHKINTKIIFINQVRGDECCQKGSLEFTRNQIEHFKIYKLPATFVLRYDALKNNEYVSLFQTNRCSLLDVGIFFEITPQLAADASVVYKGNTVRWYRAQYAYLVGYSQSDRKKIIDTAMGLYKKQFGQYPHTTGGWMIDTYSAQYLSSTYGVTAHEITREQYGTDGYALYGGPITSVYTPSKNWIFMPATSQNDALPMKILRQTISDPVRNYGDLTSGYTSQPNDYGKIKGFGYFKHLLSQVEYYSQPIAVLGLENSLEKKYQDIFKEQIQFVAKYVDNKNILLPNQIDSMHNLNYIYGSDYNNKNFRAFWIETPTYRVRIVQQGTSILLSDLRVFDSKLTDPYLSVSTGEKTAFWEIPFIFDTSKKGLPKDTTELTRKIGAVLSSFGRSNWLQEQLNPVLNEKFIYEINGIQLPHIKQVFDISIYRKDDVIVLKYTGENNTDISITFDTSFFTVEGGNQNNYRIFGPIGSGTELKQEKTQDRTRFIPIRTEINGEDAIPMSENTSSRESEAQISIIYNASLSLIGRNPARIVVVSKDSGGKPVKLQKLSVIYANGKFDSVKISETEGHLGEFEGMYYIDIEQKKAGSYTPILSYNDNVMLLQPVSFVFDCKQDIKACLLSPQKLIEYMKVKVEDVMNRR